MHGERYRILFEIVALHSHVNCILCLTGKKFSQAAKVGSILAKSKVEVEFLF